MAHFHNEYPSVGTVWPRAMVEHGMCGVVCRQTGYGRPHGRRAWQTGEWLILACVVMSAARLDIACHTTDVLSRQVSGKSWYVVLSAARLGMAGHRADVLGRQVTGRG